jgi:mannose-6-phosphate isomerase-like protein (cupin superfamily)
LLHRSVDRRRSRRTTRRHQGHEIGNVVSGVLTVDVGFDTYELHPGDSITYPSTTPHRISNQGAEDAVAIWLNLD